MLNNLVAKEIPGLSIIPLGVKEERYQISRWINYYSYFNINANTLTIAALSAMQYIQA